MITFKEYIDTFGIARFAELYQVTERCVRYWRLGQKHPKPKMARKIVADSDGAITLAAIYRED